VDIPWRWSVLAAVPREINPQNLQIVFVRSDIVSLSSMLAAKDTVVCSFFGSL
jgi:hypothetical protein